MTNQANETADDLISQDQAGLDAEQTQEAPASQYVTTADLQRLEAQVRGIQGMFDKGLNAIRRDYEDRVSKGDSDRKLDAQIEAIPEENRDILEPIFRQNAVMAADIAALKAQREAPATTSAGSNVDWEPVRTFVRDSYGLDPDTQGIDYNIWLNPQIEAGDKLKTFIANLKLVERQTAGRQAAPATQVRDRPSSSDNPPVGGVPSGSGSLTTRQDIEDAWLRGELDDVAHEKRLQEVGITS